MGIWGVGRRKPLNLGGKWKLLCRKKTRWGGGWGREKLGWERLKPKSSLRWSSTVNNLPLGKSSWLEFPYGPESLIPATRSGLQLFSVTHTAWGPISCHTTDYFQG